jgi:predicted CopG family antitoxin
VSEEREFTPAEWLPGPHLQAVGARLLRLRGGVRYERERREIAAGDVVDLDCGQVDRSTQTMHITCMATKTISLRLEAYERLKRARRFPDESFSEVISRAVWPNQTVTGAELLEHLTRAGAHLSEEELDRIEAAAATREPAEDKWARD